MKKMAIFVEGQTELYFVDRLLREIVDERKLQIVLIKATGGARSTRSFEVLEDSGGNTEKNFYIQIINSGTDNRVGSDIRDSYESLVRGGYSFIIGIRDVYPIPVTDIARLRIGLRYRLKTNPISVLFALGVMEVEAWFLAEHTHFQRVHPNLTVERINTELGFDPSTEDMQIRMHPASDLNGIYALEGLAYQKTRSQVQRTINVLDYADIYLSHRCKFPDVEMLIAKIDEFFA
jgi:hypothetical protein